MIEVNVHNIITNRSFCGVFETQEEADAWIAKLEKKAKVGKGWGWNARVMPLSEVSAELKDLIVDEYDELVEKEYEKLAYVVNEEGKRVPAKDESGEPIFETVPAVYRRMAQLKKEYVIEVKDITDKVTQQRLNAESQKYLDETDWYVVRQLETGIKIPAEITLKREQARAAIKR